MSTPRVLVVVALLCMLAAPPGGAFVEPAAGPAIQRAFHIVGIPGVKRNGRVDVQFTADKLQFKQGDRQPLTVPFERITRMQMLDGTRTYAKATYASVVAFGLPGLLVLAKKSRVDTLIFDYVNERGGQMGLIVQVPAGRGAACREWLAKHGVTVKEPPFLAAPGK